MCLAKDEKGLDKVFKVAGCKAARLQAISFISDVCKLRRCDPLASLVLRQVDTLSLIRLYCSRTSSSEGAENHHGMF